MTQQTSTMYEERYNTHHNINKNDKLPSNTIVRDTFDHSLFECEVTKNLSFWQ